jgi:7-carboxy-7-deazaguanine synthase
MPAKKQGVRGGRAKGSGSNPVKAAKKAVKVAAKKAAAKKPVPRKKAAVVARKVVSKAKAKKKAVAPKKQATKGRQATAPVVTEVTTVVVAAEVELASAPAGEPEAQETAQIPEITSMEQAMALAPRPLNVSEIFVSIQGEGQWAGIPSVFVRLNGCNLRCAWCDTPYTSWQPEGSDWMFGGLLAQIRRQGTQHVVVTGGEPLLQSSVVLLMQRLREMEFTTTIETAGTVFLPGIQCNLMSISPKLAHSVPHRREGGRWVVRHESLRYNPEAIRQLMKAGDDYQLKFVVQTVEDMDEVIKIVKEVEADRSKVVLMGEGTDPGTLYERAQWVVEACKYNGFRYSPRLQIDLWGNQRGK